MHSDDFCLCPPTLTPFRKFHLLFYRLHTFFRLLNSQLTHVDSSKRVSFSHKKIDHWDKMTCEGIKWCHFLCPWEGKGPSAIYFKEEYPWTIEGFPLYVPFHIIYAHTWDHKYCTSLSQHVFVFFSTRL